MPERTGPAEPVEPFRPASPADTAGLGGQVRPPNPAAVADAEQHARQEVAALEAGVARRARHLVRWLAIPAGRWLANGPQAPRGISGCGPAMSPPDRSFPGRELS
jgi:hypothetical protein